MGRVEKKVISNSSWIIEEETVAVNVILHGSRSAAIEGGGKRRGTDNGIARFVEEADNGRDK